MAQCGWFMNVSQAKGFCKELLATAEYQDGDLLDRFDAMRLKSILRYALGEGYGRVRDYPESPIKGFGVEGQRLAAHFEDGDIVPFYWQKLFTRPGGRDTALAAMRAAVGRETRGWLKQNPDCALCGAMGEQVDHIQPFADLALSWMEAEELDWGDVRTKVMHKAGFHRRLFVDGELGKSWVAWHKEKATLRSLCVPCHEGRGNNRAERQMVA